MLPTDNKNTSRPEKLCRLTKSKPGSSYILEQTQHAWMQMLQAVTGVIGTAAKNTLTATDIPLLCHLNKYDQAALLPDSAHTLPYKPFQGFW